MKATTITQILNLVKSTKGKFTSVEYTNQKGETKMYTIRTGVKKHLRGGTKPLVENAATVYSIKDKSYKTFKAEGIEYLKCGKLVYSKP